MKSMRVKAMRTLRGPELVANAGDEFECAPRFLESLLAAGAVEMLPTKARAVEAPGERAIEPQAEELEAPRARVPAKAKAKRAPRKRKGPNR